MLKAPENQRFISFVYPYIFCEDYATMLFQSADLIYNYIYTAHLLFAWMISHVWNSLIYCGRKILLNNWQIWQIISNEQVGGYDPPCYSSSEASSHFPNFDVCHVMYCPRVSINSIRIDLHRFQRWFLHQYAFGIIFFSFVLWLFIFLNMDATQTELLAST